MATNPLKKPTPRELKKEESRKAIAAAAVKLFEEKGYEATTMDEIALEAGVSRPTVFNYFNHKEDILLVLGAMMGERMAAQLTAFTGGDTQANPVETLRRAVVTMAKSFAEYPETARAFHALRVQAMRSRPTGAKLVEALPGDNEFVQVIGFLAGVMEQAQQQRMIRADFPPLEILAHILIGLFATVMGIWTYGGCQPDQLVDLLVRHFDITLNGIRG